MAVRIKGSLPLTKRANRLLPRDRCETSPISQLMHLLCRLYIFIEAWGTTEFRWSIQEPLGKIPHPPVN